MRTALAGVAIAAAMAAPVGADQLLNPPLFGTNPGLPVIQLPSGLDGTGRIPDCNVQGVCNPAGYGSSGRSGVRDYYRDLRPDMRGQSRFRSTDDYRLPDSGYRQPDAYIDLDLAQPRYRSPAVVSPRSIDGNPAISGQLDLKSHVGWCQDRYRSYRASDNTFQPYQGARRSCDSPFD
jgi:hypothetical protein